MEKMLDKLVEIATTAGSKILLALLVFIIGRIVIKKIVGIVERLKSVDKLDPTVRSFIANFVKIALNVILIISIINILGVPMASVVTVLASAGVAIGMSLQGALSNLAGGIMLLIFRPFNVGDYVSAAGEEGTVKDIAMFYTVLLTVDNRRITIPNGALMNANVTNFSCEENRRVDLVFSCGKGENVENVQNVIAEVVKRQEKVLSDPAVFVRLTGATNEAMEFTVRAWVKSADYWDVYFDLLENGTTALGEAGISAPAVRVITEEKKN